MCDVGKARARQFRVLKPPQHGHYTNITVGCMYASNWCLHDHLGPGPAHRAKGTGCASVSMGVPEDAPGHWLQESMLRVFVARVVVATHQYLIV